MDKNYEKLVEYIISDDTEKAKELFHNIVVATSREIWESMEHMDHEELADGIAADEEMAPVEEASEDEVTDMMQDMDDTSDMDNMDDMGDMGDMGDMDDMGDAEGEESEDLEDRVMDLEDALDELKAEFDALMADEESEPEHNDGSMDPNFGAEEGEEEEEEMEMEGTFVREYVEKVADTGQSNPSGKMAGTGAKSENQGEKNTKSPVAGKNDMGGNAVMSKGGNQNQDGTSAPSSDKAQGLPHSGKFLNVPGAKAGATYNTSKKPVSSEPSGVNKKSIES
jgi:hypothetical protein